MGKRIILGVTGGEDAAQTPKLAANLINDGHEVKIVVTDPAMSFIGSEYLSRSFTNLILDEFGIESIRIWKNSDERSVGKYRNSNQICPTIFCEWAEALLIAPLTASTLGKMANGISDNFLTYIVRAWQKDKPLILAPAMNTEMWEDPITRVQLDALRTLNTFSIDGLIEVPRFRCVSVVDPIEKMLACGVKGKGAMADIGDIIRRVNELS